jgi:hypothetical protein
VAPAGVAWSLPGDGLADPDQRQAEPPTNAPRSLARAWPATTLALDRRLREQVAVMRPDDGSPNFLGCTADRIHRHIEPFLP